MPSSFILFTILLLYFFHGTGVGGAKFTIVNNCSHIVWPAVVGTPRLQSTGFELPQGNSVAFQAPTGWNGRLWGRTGCTFNASGFGSCATGDCRSQLECNSNTTATTLIEFTLGGASNLDFYDVSLVDGYNLPVLVEPRGGSGRCRSTGCPEDLTQICPSQLRTGGGGACRGLCEAFNSPEYCCTGNYSSPSTCGPTNYSLVLKRACPNAYTYPFDDATSTFVCTTGADYFIAFCPTSLPQTGQGMPPAQSPGLDPGVVLSKSGGNHAKVIIIATALSITGVITVFTTILCLFKRRRSTSVPNKESKQVVENFLLQHGSRTPKRFKYSEIKRVTKSFSDKLGKGGYGSVYKGMLPDGTPVAVKVLIEADSNGEEFMNEVASISRTSHVNIVSLLGFCYEGNKRALVYEFMPNRSLDKFLENNVSKRMTDCCLDLEQLYKIAVGIGKGLEYLHTGCTTRIVHFDIKPQNILLDEEFCPKISDFGLAKLCKKKQSVLSVVGTRGTVGYIAPEVFSRNFGVVSYKSDVYSYGMVVLEMAGAGTLVEPKETQSSENYFPDTIYEQVVLDGTERLDDLLKEEEETRRKMFFVGFWCIQMNPSDRPSMSKVVEMLEGSVQSIQIPPKPYLFTPKLSEQEISSSFLAEVDEENFALDTT